MSQKFNWTNPSVLRFAAGGDPVIAMENRARQLVLEAMDSGWGGPPFDPLALAALLKIHTEARGDIPDARLRSSSEGQLVLEYNPMRPRGRLRFSIAHEVAHSLFADCHEEVRHRNGETASRSDNWQLEVLCNIGAAELLMPLGSFPQLAGSVPTIQQVAEIRKTFDVSVEACLIRSIKLATSASAAFCASFHQDDGVYRVDYVIPAPGWNCPVRPGQSFNNEGVVSEASAIGFTSIGDEHVQGESYWIECMGLAPYPGNLVPRVVGILRPDQATEFSQPVLTEVVGDVLKPQGSGPKLIAHIVPNTPAQWGGRGFAHQVKKNFPEVWDQYRSETTAIDRIPALGQVYIGTPGNGISFAHMVAQKGYGPAKGQRLSYAAFATCLSQVRNKALEIGASVHMPRVGTGHGGANWDVIKELISEELVDKGVRTTVYQLPSSA
ncbi:ImmA/IrrE family metallo-endopeptidase [Pseudomonas moraviensis]|uniref:ImmA/IrrE family metallo-endopeptidase n=1 Tax=Pseudomonas moraviensis TaxID=321662 RepID=UPI002092B3DE|nr:ImmA/IrrE family metallo-endopeptidase [Pseudomonas moraviensis]UST61946.1 ImmA/IrrE family metallo-endopeptidase [Pseudomonas moraviensis]